MIAQPTCQNDKVLQVLKQDHRPTFHKRRETHFQWEHLGLVMAPAFRKYSHNIVLVQVLINSLECVR